LLFKSFCPNFKSIVKPYAMEGKNNANSHHSLQVRIPHSSVFIHAWERSGQPYHLPGQYDAATGWYTFTLERVGLADLRELSFKFYFPGTSPPWESDDYIRAMPGRDVIEVWTCDYTRRCLTTNPDLFTGPPVAQLMFHVLTKQKFAGGKLYAWSPAAHQSVTAKQSSRDDTQQLSTFDLTLQPWMQQGFYFKLVDRQGNYEADRNIRIWLPIDGAQVDVTVQQSQSTEEPSLKKLPCT
jgi:hypothetical protein